MLFWPLAGVPKALALQLPPSSLAVGILKTSPAAGRILYPSLDVFFYGKLP
jgi:hypothetical protein